MHVYVYASKHFCWFFQQAEICYTSISKHSSDLENIVFKWQKNVMLSGWIEVYITANYVYPVM